MMNTSKLLLALLSCVFSVAMQAQDTLFVQGVVLVDTLYAPLDRVELEICRNGKSWEKASADGAGEFVVYLLTGAEYSISFSRKGFLSKRVSLDVREMVKGKEEIVEMEVSLVPRVKGFSKDLESELFAKGTFDIAIGSIVFDNAYTDQQRLKWREEVLRAMRDE
jgi:hypothetical protein